MTIERAPQLNLESFQRLLSGEVTILVVSEYVSHLVCSKIMEYVELCNKVERYTHEETTGNKVEHRYFGVDRIGTPFNSIFGADDRNAALELYQKDALPRVRALRNAILPYLHPIDRLRLELDETWDPGAAVAAFLGRKMFVGIVRLMKPNTSALSESNPHRDVLPTSVHKLRQQLAANCFIAVPEEGGELQVWPNSDGKERHQFDPDAYVMCNPRVGELILFNARNWHAIRRFEAGIRVSLQCFVGVDSRRRLHLWN